MLVKRRRAWDLPSSDITAESSYLDRRRFLAATAGAMSAALLPASTATAQTPLTSRKGPFSTDEKPNTFEDVTGYNNFYEFGLDKGDPARYAGKMTIAPWSIRVDGLVEKPGDIGLEDFTKPYPLEERTYRLRCVEAWSMVIPWVGFPLADLIRQLKPKPEAKFVSFTTALKRGEMPALGQPYLPWPYVEALRLDEAMNPLAFVAVGLYGKSLLNRRRWPAW